MKHLAFVISLLSMVAFSAATFAQTNLSPRFVERALTAHYEALANDSLSYLLTETEFKVFVDVNLDTGVDLVKESELQNQEPLPGTIRHFEMADEQISRFEQLPHKRSVMLLLDPKVTPEKEALIKEALTGKLRLNLTGNIDALVTRRTAINVPKGNDRMPASATGENKNPTEVGRTTLFGIIFGVLAAIALMGFYLLKWKKKSREESLEAKADALGKPRGPEGELEFDKDDEHSKKTDGADETVAAKIPVEHMLPNRIETHDEIIARFESISRAHSGLVSQAVQNLSEDSGNMPRIAATIELLGHEKALTLFREVPQKVWASVGQYMAMYPLSQDNPVNLEEVAVLYRSILAYVIQNKGFDSKASMQSSLDAYSPQQIASALSNENQKLVATLLSGISQSKAYDIISHLEPAMRSKVLSTMASIKSVDISQLKSIEEGIVARLESSGDGAMMSTQNDERIFVALSHLSPHEEEALFAQMSLSDPSVEARARTYRLYSVHLKTLRTDILRDEIGNLSPDQIAKVLRGLEASIVSRVCGVLSERKAMVVKTTLDELREMTMTGEFAVMRREVLDMIYAKHIAPSKDFADAIFEDGATKRAA